MLQALPDPPSPLNIILGRVFGANMPADELSAAVVSETLATGAQFGYASCVARVLRTQLALQQPALTRQRMMQDLDAQRPLCIQPDVFQGALWQSQARRPASRYCQPAAAYGRCPWTPLM